jgi:hypothetical protein
VVILRYLSQDQLHFSLFPKTQPYTFVLKKLVVTLEILATSINLQNQVESRLYFYLKATSFIVNLPQDVSNELIRTGHKRLKKGDWFELTAELSDVYHGFNLCFSVKGLTKC